MAAASCEIAYKSRTEARVGLEQLDHRQLLAVNFTGVVATDFLPVTQVPGVVDILDNGNLGVQYPLIPADIAPIVKVSGFAISGMAVSYDAADDTLSVGLIQPSSQNSTNGTVFPVIAGDSDNNGDSGTVNPLLVNPNFDPGMPIGPGNEPGLRQNDFADPADMGGSKTMGAFLNFTGAAPVPGNPSQTFFPADVVAGFANNGSSNAPKHYEVAQGINFGPSIPGFGTELPNNEGNVYLVNDPSRGALEFSITHFSELYTAETGKPLTSASVIRIGAFGSSNQDDGISEAFFPPQPLDLAAATVPPTPPPPMCAPVSPPVLINPHEARHVNTAHAESVRVTIVSSSGFNATQIDPATVRLGGAAPFTSFPRNFNHADYSSETFVFRGYDISLPAGITPATVTGQLFDGTKFSTTELIFNRNDSFYTPAQIAARDAKIGFQPPEELALEMASLNAGGDIATINANILAANEVAAAAAETIPSNYLTFAPICVDRDTCGGGCFGQHHARHDSHARGHAPEHTHSRVDSQEVDEDQGQRHERPHLTAAMQRAAAVSASTPSSTPSINLRQPFRPRPGPGGSGELSSADIKTESVQRSATLNSVRAVAMEGDCPDIFFAQ